MMYVVRTLANIKSWLNWYVIYAFSQHNLSTIKFSVVISLLDCITVISDKVSVTVIAPGQAKCVPEIGMPVGQVQIHCFGQAQIHSAK